MERIIFSGGDMDGKMEDFKISEDQLRYDGSGSPAFPRGTYKKSDKIPLCAAENFFKYAFAEHEVSYLDRFTWGEHASKDGELILDEGQENDAKSAMEHSATFILAVQIDTYLESVYGKSRFEHKMTEVQSSSYIANVLRNAYAHNPFVPMWRLSKKGSIDKKFTIDGVIKLETTGKEGKIVRFDDFGGPLSLLRFSEYVRNDLDT